jgi:CheY-like chemotaxis protein
MANGAVVLVVEDEPLVRALTVDALEDDGFNVLEARQETTPSPCFAAATTFVRS